MTATDPLQRAPAGEALHRPAWPAAAPAAGAALLGAGEVHLWWLDLAAPLVPLHELETSLDADERGRAMRFHFDLHRRRFVAAHGQMRMLLGAYLGLAPADVAFEREERGKPRLAPPRAGAPPQQDLTFNLSHSQDQGLLAIARGTTLGADIEVQHPLRELESLARSHFTAAELRDLHSLPEDRRHDGFFAAWTRKEAYVKALGAGLSVPLDSFEVALHPDLPAALRSVNGREEDARAWTLWADRPTPSSWAALAVRAPAARVRTFALGALEGPAPLRTLQGIMRG